MGEGGHPLIPIHTWYLVLAFQYMPTNTWISGVWQMVYQLSCTHNCYFVPSSPIKARPHLVFSNRLTNYCPLTSGMGNWLTNLHPPTVTILYLAHQIKPMHTYCWVNGQPDNAHPHLLFSNWLTQLMPTHTCCLVTGSQVKVFVKSHSDFTRIPSVLCCY